MIVIFNLIIEVELYNFQCLFSSLILFSQGISKLFVHLVTINLIKCVIILRELKKNNRRKKFFLKDAYRTLTGLLGLVIRICLDYAYHKLSTLVSLTPQPNDPPHTTIVHTYSFNKFIDYNVVKND